MGNTAVIRMDDKQASKKTQQQPTSAVGPAEQPTPKHRQCPLCFAGSHGRGLAYCTQGRVRYYKCDTCAHTWRAVVDVRIIEIESRTVNLSTRDGKR